MNSEIFNLNKAKTELPYVNTLTKVYDYILWDVDNLFPNRVIDLTYSPTLSAILTSKAKMVAGCGIENEETMDDIAKSFFYLNDIIFQIKRLARDYVVFGGFSCFLVWSKDRTSIAKIEHLDFSKIRIGFPDEETLDINKYYYSDNWNEYSNYNFQPKELDAFDFETKQQCPRQLYYFKNYKEGEDYYPIPEWWSIADAAQTEIEILRSDLKLIQNALRFSGFLSMPNIPIKEEQDAMVKKMREFFEGSDQSGKFLTTFSDSENTIQAPIYTAFNDGINVDAYANKLMQCQNIILKANRYPAVLAGITGDSLSIAGSADEIKNQYEMLMSNVINSYQYDIERMVNKILRINGSSFIFKIKNKSILNEILSESVLNEILTKDELRSKIGYENLLTKETKELNGE